MQSKVWRLQIYAKFTSWLSSKLAFFFWIDIKSGYHHIDIFPEKLYEFPTIDSYFLNDLVSDSTLPGLLLSISAPEKKFVIFQ
jgi:DNA modification methylase